VATRYARLRRAGDRHWVVWLPIPPYGILAVTVTPPST
jgi:hypothetical protein